MQQKIYDIIIAGAGPAGLTAAVYARRAGKSVLLIEKEAFGGQITLSPHVENYPFTRPMSGNELVEVLVEQVMNLGADVEVGAVVDVSENADKTVTVRTDYQEFTGRTLIIATGLKHRLPGAEGEQKFIGSGISFCAVCDGAFFKDKDVCVVGGGNTAMEDALYLAGFCRKVYVLNRSKKFRAAATMVENVKRNGKITVLTDTVVDKFVGSNMLEGVDIRNTVTDEKSILNVSGAIVAIGVKPSSDLAKDCGVECCQHGFVKTDMYLATNIKGIFAAGDVRVSPLRQVITAAADGAIAATSAVNYVNELGIKSI